MLLQQILNDISLNENGFENVIENHLKSILKELKVMSANAEHWKRFEEIAKVINVFFPEVSDSSLFEVDDLLFQNDPEASNLITELEKLKTLRKSYETFNITNLLILKEISYEYIKIYIKSYELIKSTNQIINNAFIQSIKNLQTGKESLDIFRFINKIQILIVSRNKYRLCVALKLLKIIVDNNIGLNDLNIQKNKIYHRHILMQLSEYRNIPQARHPDNCRISSFIARHSSHIYDKLYHKLSKVDEQLDKYLEAQKNGFYDKESIFVTLNSLLNNNVSQIEYFYKLLACVKDENELYDRLESFLIGAESYAERLWMLGRIISNVLCDIRYMLDYCYSLENEMRYIDAHYGYEFGTTLSEIKNQPTNCNNLNALKNSKIPEDDDKNDYHLDKFLVYDHFMKCLHVLNNIYNARNKYEDIFKRKIRNDHITRLFRYNRYDQYISNLLNKALCNPSEHGHLSWYLETIMDKCPFLVFPPEQECMMEDMKKMLKGEVIDDVIEENLYFALNTMEK